MFLKKENLMKNRIVYIQHTLKEYMYCVLSKIDPKLCRAKKFNDKIDLEKETILFL